MVVSDLQKMGHVVVAVNQQLESHCQQLKSHYTAPFYIHAPFYFSFVVIFHLRPLHRCSVLSTRLHSTRDSTQIHFHRQICTDSNGYPMASQADFSIALLPGALHATAESVDALILDGQLSHVPRAIELAREGGLEAERKDGCTLS